MSFFPFKGWHHHLQCWHQHLGLCERQVMIWDSWEPAWWSEGSGVCAFYIWRFLSCFRLKKCSKTSSNCSSRMNFHPSHKIMFNWRVLICNWWSKNFFCMIGAAIYIIRVVQFHWLHPIFPKNLWFSVSVVNYINKRSSFGLRPSNRHLYLYPNCIYFFLNQKVWPLGLFV